MGMTKGPTTFNTASGSGGPTTSNGTWTPSLFFGSPAAQVGMTFTTQTGQWTKIGNRVFAQSIITLSNKGSSTGSAYISLPFPNVNLEGSGGILIYWTAMSGISNQIDARYNSGIAAPTLYFALYFSNTGNTGITDLSDGSFTNTSSFIMNMDYNFS